MLEDIVKMSSRSPTPTQIAEAVVKVYGNNAEFDARVYEALSKPDVFKNTPEKLLRMWRLADISRIPDLQHDICWIDEDGSPIS